MKQYVVVDYQEIKEGGQYYLRATLERGRLYCGNCCQTALTKRYHLIPGDSCPDCGARVVIVGKSEACWLRLSAIDAMREAVQS